MRINGPLCFWTTEPCTSPLARMASRAIITAGYSGTTPPHCIQPEISTSPPTPIQGGIWQSGGGPSADLNHNVFVATGDGPFDANRGGMSYSDSYLRFGPAAGLSMVADYFTPCDQAALQTAGLDVGASAPVVVQNSPSQPNLLIGGSKDGTLYVVNPDNMGNFDSNCSNDSPPRVQSVSVGAGATILSTPLFWNDSVYVAPGNGNLMSFPMSGGILASSPSASQSPETLGPQGATPVISSNGTSNAILWLIDSSGALATPNTPAILRAFDPNNLSNEIYNSAMAALARYGGPGSEIYCSHGGQWEGLCRDADGTRRVWAVAVMQFSGTRFSLFAFEFCQLYIANQTGSSLFHFTSLRNSGRRLPPEEPR